MSSYIKSEVYRLLHYKWTYFFVGICSLLLVSANVVLAVVKQTDEAFPYATTNFSFSNLYSNVVMVFILCVMVANMVFGNENANHTMKNSITYGISRSTIYFGKFIVQIIYAISAFAIIVGVYVMSGYLLLTDSRPAEIELLVRTCLACLPFFIFGLAVTNCFAFIMESSGAIAAACGIMIAFPLVCNLLGMRFDIFAQLGKVLPLNIMNSIEFNEATQTMDLYWSTAIGFRNCWIIGLIQTIIIIVFGFVLFRKKEIK